MLADLKITEFLDKTASATAVPGGGSVAALNASLAASLIEMVANLTIGKKKYDSVDAEMQAIAALASEMRAELVQSIDKDAAAYNEVMTAFKMPKETEQETEQRSRAIQQGLKNAASVPLSVARDAYKIMDLAGKVIQKGNKNAVTDGAVGAMTARTAALAALFNVKINLSSIKDEAFVDKLAREVRELERRVEQKEREILSQVKY